MERIINKGLLRYLLEHRLITRHQHGFIKHKSVATNLLECLEDWTERNLNKLQRIQNTLARVTCQSPRSSSASSLRKS